MNLVAYYLDLHLQSTLSFKYIHQYFRSEENEVAGTGKVSPNTHTLPLSMIGNQQAFEMDADEFEIVCGFPKPTPDETLVFTCAAGVRSHNACAYAAQAGYMQLVNYKGGAYDWFTGN
jgi:rhodanese-related sulfurtransferase